MMNLIPNVYQAAFMSRLGHGAIEKQVEKSRISFGEELRKKASQIYKRGFQEGEQNNVLGKDGAAYTAYLYIDSEKDKETKVNSFPTTLQLLNFIEVKNFAELYPPFIYWELNGKIYFDRLEYFEAAYKASHKNQGTLDAQNRALYKTKETKTLVLTKTEKKGALKELKRINEIYLDHMFENAPESKHPENEKIIVKHLELKKMTRDRLDIYKFKDFKDGKVFGEYKIRPLKETLGTYAELLQETVESFTNVFDIESLKKNMLKDYNKRELKTKRNLKSDINYTEEYKQLTYKNAVTNEEQRNFLTKELEKLELTGEKKSEIKAVKAILLLLGDDKVINKTDKGKYGLKESEGTLHSEETNDKYVEDQLINGSDKSNESQKKIAQDLLRQFKKSVNVNKAGRIKRIKEIIALLKKADPSQYFHVDDLGFFGLTNIIKKPPSTVFGIPSPGDYLKKMEELEKSRVTNPTLSTGETKPELSYDNLFDEETESSTFNQMLADLINIYRQSGERNKTREGAKLFIFESLEKYRKESINNSDEVNAFISLNDLHLKGLKIATRDLVNVGDMIYLPFHKIVKKYSFGEFELKLVKGDLTLNNILRDRIRGLTSDSRENLIIILKQMLTGKTYSKNPKAQEIVKLNGF